MKTALFTACMLAMGVPAPTSDDTPREELTMFQGVWRFVKNNALPEEGRRLSEWGATCLSVVIEGNAGWVREDQEVIARFHIALDPSKSPKRMDLTIDYFLPEADPRNKNVLQSMPRELKVTGRTLLAIYSIDGDVIKLFASAGGKQRPSEFPVGLDGRVTTLRRSGPVTNSPAENRFFEERARAAAKDLSNSIEEVRFHAAAELLRLRERAAPAIPELIAGLRNTQSDVAPALILGQIGEPAVEPLIALLQEGPKVDRASALLALAQIGPRAKVAVPSVRELLNNDDPNVVVLAAYALARIESERRAEAIKVLQSMTTAQRRGTDSVPFLLAWLSPEDAGPAMPLLTQSLRSESCMFGNFMRLLGAYGMAVLGPAAHPATPALRDALADREPLVQVLSAYALAQASPRDRARALAVLVEISTKNSDPLLDRTSLEHQFALQRQPGNSAYNSMVLATLDALLAQEPGNQFPTDYMLRWIGRGLRQPNEELTDWLRGDPLAAGLAREMVWRLDPETAKKSGIRTLDR